MEVNDPKIVLKEASLLFCSVIKPQSSSSTGGESRAVHPLLAKVFIAFSDNKYLDKGTILPLKSIFLLISIVIGLFMSWGPN